MNLRSRNLAHWLQRWSMLSSMEIQMCTIIIIIQGHTTCTHAHAFTRQCTYIDDAVLESTTLVSMICTHTMWYTYNACNVYLCFQIYAIAVSHGGFLAYHNCRYPVISPIICHVWLDFGFPQSTSIDWFTISFPFFLSLLGVTKWGLSIACNVIKLIPVINSTMVLSQWVS